MTNDSYPEEQENPGSNSDEITKLLMKAASDAALKVSERLVRHGPQILRGKRIREKGFQDRLYDRWAYPLDMYELCLYLASQCGQFFNTVFRRDAATNKDHKFEALIRLHAGSVRVAGEILCLLRGGYASGAHARWRTLHETAVVALFLSQEPADVSERYLLHQFVKSQEDALQHQKHAERLHMEPLTDEEMTQIAKGYAAVLAKYGADFRHDYAWARPALERRKPEFKGQRIGFQHLQSAVEIEHWTPYYRMASHAIHPSATFTRFTLGAREEVPPMLAGPSNADLADPGQGALLSLTHATAALMSYAPVFDNVSDVSALTRYEPVLEIMAMTLALNALSDVAIHAFAEVQQKLEAEIQEELEMMKKTQDLPKEDE